MYIQQLTALLTHLGMTAVPPTRRNSQSSYLSWQRLCHRLQRLCPDWHISYSDPVLVSGYITVRCRLTLGGITREATGSDKTHQVARGTRTVANPEAAAIAAFMNAASLFGIGVHPQPRGLSRAPLRLPLQLALPVSKVRRDRPRQSGRPQDDEIGDVVKLLRTLPQRRQSKQLRTLPLLQRVPAG